MRDHEADRRSFAKGDAKEAQGVRAFLMKGVTVPADGRIQEVLVEDGPAEVGYLIAEIEDAGEDERPYMRLFKVVKIGPGKPVRWLTLAKSVSS